MLQFFERLLDFAQLQVERPELRRIACGQIRSQEITPFAATGLAQGLPVQSKAEALRRDRLILLGQPHVDDPPGRRPSLFASGPSLISNWSPVSFCWRNSCSRFTGFFSRRRRIACSLS